MPFRHPDRSHDLGTRIEHEVRERLEEAIDFVCLEALVKTRRARGAPAPVAENPADRAEYETHVSAFLRLLTAEVRAADVTRASETDAPDARLLARQVALARTLPDYWQQFETVSARYLDLAEPPTSGGERRSLLARLFGRA